MERKDNRVIVSRVTMKVLGEFGKVREGTSYEATTSTDGSTIVWDEKPVIGKDSSRTVK